MLKAALLLVGTWTLAGAVAAPLTVKDLDGRAWTPLQPASGQIHLLVFVSAGCPISNRYAPEIDRITAAYVSRHVQSFLVYTDPKISSEDVRASIKAFHPGLRAAAVIDEGLQLATAVKATLTPETAIYTANGRVYLGRIDDLYLNIGQSRRAATQRDLRDALDAALSGRPVLNRRRVRWGALFRGLGDRL